MKLEDLKFNDECTCPICGSHEVDFGLNEVDCETMWYPCECEKCGATWQEVYNITFTQVDEVYDKDGNKLYSSCDEV